MKFKMLPLVVMLLMLVGLASAQTLMSKEDMGRYGDVKLKVLGDNKIDLYDGVTKGNCFYHYVANEEVCFKSAIPLDFYYKDMNVSVKFGWQVTGKIPDVLVIYSNIDIESFEYIDWSDMGEAGLKYDIQGNIITIYNPSYTNGWIDPVIETGIGNSATAYNSQRKIVQLSNGTIYTTYEYTEPDNDKIIKLSKSIDNGSTWTIYNITNSPVTEDNRFSSMVLDETESLIHITWENRDDTVDTSNDIYYTQWNITSDSLVSVPVPIYLASAANTEGFNPDITILNNGTLGVVFEREDGVTVCKDISFLSCDSVGDDCTNAGNWSSETVIADCSAMNNEDQDFADIETNGTQWFVVWKGQNGTYPTRDQIFYRHYNGTSWETAEVIDGDDLWVKRVPSLVVINNTPHVAADQDFGSSFTDIGYSNRSGGTWGTWLNISGPFKGDTQWQSSISSNGTDLFVVWNAFNISNNGQDCVGMVNSSDNGSTWTTAGCVPGTNTTKDWINYPILSYQYNFSDTGVWDLMLLYTKQINASHYNVTFLNLGGGAPASPAAGSPTASNGLNTPVLETSRQEFNLTFTWNATALNVTNITARFWWNGTERSVTKISNDYYLANFTLPLGGGTFPALWSYNWTLNGTNTTEVNNSRNQVVTEFSLNNCSGASNETLRFVIKNEDTDANINATFEAQFDMWLTTRTLFRNFTFDFATNENHTICIEPDFGNFLIDANIEYGATGFDTRFYQFDDFNINNTQQNFTLYLIDTNLTENVILKVRELATQIPIPGANIRVLKEDTGSGTFIQVNSVLTDFTGDVTVQLIPFTENYKFQVYVDGNLEGTFGPLQISQNQYFLRVDLTDDVGQIFYDSLDVSATLTCGKGATNNTVTFTFGGPTGEVSQGCLKIIRETTTGPINTLPQTCVTGASGSINYAIGNNSGTYVAIASYINDNGEEVPLQTCTTEVGGAFAIFGLLGVFLSFLLIISSSFAASWGPVPLLLGFLVGIYSSVVIGIMPLTWGGIIIVTILTGVHLFKAR